MYRRLIPILRYRWPSTRDWAEIPLIVFYND
jgi:hypothetical protein